jgi:hypothetical protein
MRDQILSGYMKNFTAEQNLANVPEDEVFEHFSNFCVISRYHPDPFALEDVRTGGGGDLGIDGLAILVNDHIVNAVESIDYFKEAFRRLEVRFIFIQSKRSVNIDLAKLGSFLYGVKRFFSRSEPAVAHDSLKHLWVLKEHIYESSIDMDRNPSCHIFYTYGGEWKGNDQVLDRVQSDLEELRSKDIFSSVDFEHLDAKELRRIYRALRHKVVRQIQFEKHTTLPKMDYIKEAYIGILPAEEYLKLLRDDDGNLMRHLFYDNVRDYQGKNFVNNEIADTLRDPASTDKFVILNNGITIVAKSMNRVGEAFTLRDYQIVNGCQTSHVLHQNFHPGQGNVFVPVKLVVTENEVTGSITQATNRQTEVKKEAFASMSPFHKELKEFYMTFGKQQQMRLYYERRSKQYDGEGLSRIQIVTLSSQLLHFVAMFLDEPHSTQRYYGEILEAYKGRVFRPNHSLFPYYLSARAGAEFDRLMLGGEIDRAYRPVKSQFLMLFRLLAVEGPLPRFDSGEMEKYCRRMLEKLDNANERLRIFDEACRVVEEAAEEEELEFSIARHRRAFTMRLVDKVGAMREALDAGVQRYRGKVRWFSYVRGYGFITHPKLRDVFLHHDEIDESAHPLQKGGIWWSLL